MQTKTETTYLREHSMPKVVAVVIQNDDKERDWHFPKGTFMKIENGTLTIKSLEDK